MLALLTGGECATKTQVRTYNSFTVHKITTSIQPRSMRDGSTTEGLKRTPIQPLTSSLLMHLN